MPMNILIAHGGGPTPVINSSLQGIIESAKNDPAIGRIYAARFGAEGILKKDIIDLTDVSDSQIALLRHTPASAIGSCRRKLAQADFPAVLECFDELKVGAFFYNGGNDSMDTCNKINELAIKEKLDLKVIGVPKTIDNDLDVTDHSPGFGSAARYIAINTAELAQDAAALPIHVVVIECMGRNAGWITAASALAGRMSDCEMLTYLPETPIDTELLLADVERSWAKGRGLVVSVSEGLRGLDGNFLADSGIVDGFGHKVAGGVSQYVADLIMARLKIKSRAEKPGLLGRTSMAYVSEVDRREAYEVGRYALKAAVEGKTGYMVAIRAERGAVYSSELFLTPLETVANVEKKFPEKWIVGGNAVADEFFDYACPIIGGGLPEFCSFRAL